MFDNTNRRKKVFQLDLTPHGFLLMTEAMKMLGESGNSEARYFALEMMQSDAYRLAKHEDGVDGLEKMFKAPDAVKNIKSVTFNPAPFQTRILKAFDEQDQNKLTDALKDVPLKEPEPENKDGEKKIINPMTGVHFTTGFSSTPPSDGLTIDKLLDIKKRFESDSDEDGQDNDIVFKPTHLAPRPGYNFTKGSSNIVADSKDTRDDNFDPWEYFGGIRFSPNAPKDLKRIAKIIVDLEEARNAISEGKTKLPSNVFDAVLREWCHRYSVINLPQPSKVQFVYSIIKDVHDSIMEDSEDF